jgi:hypothetical protein
MSGRPFQQHNRTPLLNKNIILNIGIAAKDGMAVVEMVE